MKKVMKKIGKKEKNGMNPMKAIGPMIKTGMKAIGRMVICTSSTAQGGGGNFKNRKPLGEVGCCESRMAERSH